MTRKLGERIRSKFNFEVILWIKLVKIEKNEKSSNRFLANCGQKIRHNELKKFTGSCHIYIYTFYLLFLSIMLRSENTTTCTEQFHGLGFAADKKEKNFRSLTHTNLRRKKKPWNRVAWKGEEKIKKREREMWRHPSQGFSDSQSAQKRTFRAAPPPSFCS